MFHLRLSLLFLIVAASTTASYAVDETCARGKLIFREDSFADRIVPLKLIDSKRFSACETPLPNFAEYSSRLRGIRLYYPSPYQSGAVARLIRSNVNSVAIGTGAVHSGKANLALRFSMKLDKLRGDCRRVSFADFGPGLRCAASLPMGETSQWSSPIRLPPQVLPYEHKPYTFAGLHLYPLPI